MSAVRKRKKFEGEESDKNSYPTSVMRLLPLSFETVDSNNELETFKSGPWASQSYPSEAQPDAHENNWISISSRINDHQFTVDSSIDKQSSLCRYESREVLGMDRECLVNESNEHNNIQLNQIMSSTELNNISSPNPFIEQLSAHSHLSLKNPFILHVDLPTVDNSIKVGAENSDDTNTPYGMINMNLNFFSSDNSKDTHQPQSTNPALTSYNGCFGTRGHWQPDEDERLRQAVHQFNGKSWKQISQLVGTKNIIQCSQRWDILKPGVVKGQWSLDEDKVLLCHMSQAFNNWGEIASHIPGRSAKQCRERWMYHLDPALKKEPFTKQEDETIVRMHDEMGGRWAEIARQLPGRSPSSVKIRFTSIKRCITTGRTFDTIKSRQRRKNL